MARLSYSTLVRGLTVVLPLMALALLSTLFLVARTVPEQSSLPFIDDLQGRAAAGDTMRTPFFTGTTENGDAITVQAALVRPDAGALGSASAEGLRADIRFQDGGTMRVDADTGSFLPRDNTLKLKGNVALESSTGYTLFAPALNADLSTGDAESVGHVRVEGPLGTINAGQLLIRRESPESFELVFTNRVKLIYLPPDRSE